MKTLFKTFFLTCMVVCAGLVAIPTMAATPAEQARSVAKSFLDSKLGQNAKYSIVKRAEKNGYYVFTVDPTQAGGKEVKWEQQASCDEPASSFCTNIVVYKGKVVFSNVTKNTSSQGLGSFYRFTKDGVLFKYSAGQADGCEAGGSLYFTYVNFTSKKILYSELIEKVVGKSPVVGDECLSPKTKRTKTTTLKFFDSPDLATRKPLNIKASSTEEAFYKWIKTNETTATTGTPKITLKTISAACKKEGDKGTVAILVNGSEVKRISETAFCLGGQEIKILKTNGNKIYFAIPPSGMGGYILYISYGSLYEYDSKAKSVVLLFGGGGTLLGISNSYLSYWDESKKLIGVMNLTKKQKQIFQLPADVSTQNEEYQMGDFTFSPDEKKLAIAVTFGGPDNPSGKIYILDIATNTWTIYKTIMSGEAHINKRDASGLKLK